MSAARWHHGRAALAIAAGTALAVPLVARAGAEREIERKAEYFDKCTFHYSQLEGDAREVATDFCANLGGVRTLDPFERHEELIRVNEFSKKYGCTVKTRVECYAAD